MSEHGPTSIRSKKLLVVLLVDATVTLAFAWAGWGTEDKGSLFSTYVTFMGMFNAAYAGINTAQKWALK
jgi:hypothetical protein